MALLHAIRNRAGGELVELGLGSVLPVNDERAADVHVPACRTSVRKGTIAITFYL